MTPCQVSPATPEPPLAHEPEPPPARNAGNALAPDRPTPYLVTMPRPRRQRFTATFLASDGSEAKEVFLAYDAEWVKDYCESLGRTAVTVRKGDYRLADRPSGVRSHILQREVLQVARDFFGLTLHLDIAQDGKRGGRYGVHNLVPHGPGVRLRGGKVYGIEATTFWSHRIRVKSWCEPDLAGRTLYHELAHAMQAERDVMPTWDATGDPHAVLAKLRTSYFDGTAYLNKPWEVEARSYEAFNAERPLAR